jgi:hypothetical protein
VASAALYGSIRQGDPLRIPRIKVLSYRALPDARHDAFNLYGVIDAIEEKVPQLPANVRVVSLSCGPPGPIDAKLTPSRFTYAIDRLHYEHGTLFIVAAGNWGHKAEDLRRLQAPADSVNNLSVGAYTVDPTTARKRIANYSCPGPGRDGGAVKPDVLQNGGDVTVPFYALDLVHGMVQGTCGTSLAGPRVAALAAELFARSPQRLSAEACRALFIHSTIPIPECDGEHGWGILPGSVDEIISCEANRVSVLYEGKLTPRTHWKLPFLLPAKFNPNGMVELSWTIVFAPETNQASPPEYTLGGIVAQLRPHEDIYSFYVPQKKGDPPNKKQERLTLNVVKDAARKAALIKAGWKQSILPTPDAQAGRLEQVLRAEEAKWDTVVRKTVYKRAEGIQCPCLTLSFFGRGSWAKLSPVPPQARYAAVLTVHAKKYKGNLYSEVVNVYTKLMPIQLRNQIQISV